MKRTLIASVLGALLLAAPAVAASPYPYRADAVIQCDRPVDLDAAKHNRVTRFRYNKYGYLEIVLTCKPALPH